MATNKSSCPHKPDVAGIHSCRSYLLWCVYSESVANIVTARSGQRTFWSNRHRKRYAPSFGARRKASAKALASINASTRTKPLGQQARQRYPQNASSTMHTVSYLPNTESLNSIAEYRNMRCVTTKARKTDRCLTMNGTVRIPVAWHIDGKSTTYLGDTTRVVVLVLPI